MTDVDMTFKTPAHLALLNYSQADEDGVMVLVSRQAIHEVSAEITRLRARLAEVEAAKAAVWDEAMTAAVEAAPTPTEDARDKETLAYIQGFMDLVQSIRTLVNPYRSKTDET